MSNTPFLFIGISFIVSSGYLLSYLLGYPFGEHFIRGSTNASS